MTGALLSGAADVSIPGAQVHSFHHDTAASFLFCHVEDRYLQYSRLLCGQIPSFFFIFVF